MKIGLLFPGQGSQDLSLLEHYPDLFSSHLNLISEMTGSNIEHILRNKDILLNTSKLIQPFLLGVSYAIYEKLSPCLAKHDIAFYAGHSLGELTAVCLAHHHPLKQGLSLAIKRAHLMESALEGKDKFCMLVALGIDAQKAQEAILDQDKVYVVNDNTQEQVVLALLENKKEEVSSILKNAGAKKLVLIPMSVISHCSELESVVSAFHQELLNDFSPYIDKGKEFLVPVLSNTTTQSQYNTTDMLKNLAFQLASKVRFKEMIDKHAQEVDCFIEIGCHRVLTGLLKKITDKPCFSTHNAQVLEELSNYLTTGELVI